MHTYYIGPAGTGKTSKVKECGLRTLMIGPTNRIARQLSKDSLTFHKFLGMSINEKLNPSNDLQIDKKLLHIINTLEPYEALYVDELSMISADNDDFLGALIDRYNQLTGKNTQCIRGGDPCQIPVVDENEEPFYKGKYFNMESSEVNYLRDVKRQKNPEWVHCLNEFRVGNPKPLIKNFQRLGGKVKCDLHSLLNYEAIITSRRKTRDNLNTLCLNLVSKRDKKKKYFYPHIKKDPEGKEVTIGFCEGYKVSFSCNTSNFSNGDIGVIKSIDEIHDNKGNITLAISILTKEDPLSPIELEIPPGGKVPFSGGHAITSHSIQGTTINAEKIYIFLDDIRMWQTPGCAYNALSRTREPHQIHLWAEGIDQLKMVCKVDRGALRFT